MATGEINPMSLAPGRIRVRKEAERDRFGILRGNGEIDRAIFARSGTKGKRSAGESNGY